MKMSLSIVAETERFKFMQFRFNPYRAWKLISEKKIRPKIIDMDISEWATKILGVRFGSKEKPKLLMFGVGTNYDHILSLTDERLEDPGIVVRTSLGAVVIDGNHRLARRYMEGKTHMTMYLLSEAQARKYNIM